MLCLVKTYRTPMPRPCDPRQDQMQDARGEVHGAENTRGQSPGRSETGLAGVSGQSVGNDYWTEDTRAEAEGVTPSTYRSTLIHLGNPYRYQ